MEELERFENLVEIMDRLRGPDGCPWDREQTFATLRGYLIEECYEVADALDREDSAGLCEELGDLMFQIVFLARLAKEQGENFGGAYQGEVRNRNTILICNNKSNCSVFFSLLILDLHLT